MRSPTFPKASTLAGRALARLLRGRKITHREFQNECASYRLSEFVRCLRETHGWQIVTKLETAKTNDPTGRIAVFGRYSVDFEYLHVVNGVLGVERIDDFIASVSRFEAKGEK